MFVLKNNGSNNFLCYLTFYIMFITIKAAVIVSSYSSVIDVVKVEVWFEGWKNLTVPHLLQVLECKP